MRHTDRWDVLGEHLAIYDNQMWEFSVFCDGISGPGQKNRKHFKSQPQLLLQGVELLRQYMNISDSPGTARMHQPNMNVDNSAFQ